MPSILGEEREALLKKHNKPDSKQCKKCNRVMPCRVFRFNSKKTGAEQLIIGYQCHTCIETRKFAEKRMVNINTGEIIKKDAILVCKKCEKSLPITRFKIKRNEKTSKYRIQNICRTCFNKSHPRSSALNIKCKNAIKERLRNSNIYKICEKCNENKHASQYETQNVKVCKRCWKKSRIVGIECRCCHKTGRVSHFPIEAPEEIKDICHKCLDSIYKLRECSYCLAIKNIEDMFPQGKMCRDCFRRRGRERHSGHNTVKSKITSEVLKAKALALKSKVIANSVNSIKVNVIPKKIKADIKITSWKLNHFVDCEMCGERRYYKEEYLETKCKPCLNKIRKTCIVCGGDKYKLSRDQKTCVVCVSGKTADGKTEKICISCCEKRPLSHFPSCDVVTVDECFFCLKKTENIYEKNARAENGQNYTSMMENFIRIIRNVKLKKS